jgi:hypothetical protein
LQVLAGYFVVTFGLRMWGGVASVVEGIVRVPEENSDSEEVGAALATLHPSACHSSFCSSGLPTAEPRVFVAQVTTKQPNYVHVLTSVLLIEHSL